MQKFLLLTVLVSTCLFISGCKQQIAGIDTSSAFSFATASTTAGAAFVTISNSGKDDITINKVSSPIAKNAELHIMRETRTGMEMRQVSFMKVPAGGSLELKPYGDHVMLLNLEAPLKEGQSFPLTFETSAGVLELDVKVRAAGSTPE
jgi:copper(I)-binding protein